MGFYLLIESSIYCTGVVSYTDSSITDLLYRFGFLLPSHSVKYCTGETLSHVYSVQALCLTLTIQSLIYYTGLQGWVLTLDYSVTDLLYSRFGFLNSH